MQANQIKILIKDQDVQPLTLEELIQIKPPDKLIQAYYHLQKQITTLHNSLDKLHLLYEELFSGYHHIINLHSYQV